MGVRSPCRRASFVPEMEVEEKTMSEVQEMQSTVETPAVDVAAPVVPEAQTQQASPQAVISMRALLEAGVHFGHQTKRWNPKMKPYIFGARNGIYIIDLQKTVGLFRRAYHFTAEIVSRGGHVLFIGTKKQAQDVVAEEAVRAGQYFVNTR